MPKPSILILLLVNEAEGLVALVVATLRWMKSCNSSPGQAADRAVEMREPLQNWLFFLLSREVVLCDA